MRRSTAKDRSLRTVRRKTNPYRKDFDGFVASYEGCPAEDPLRDDRRPIGVQPSAHRKPFVSWDTQASR